MVDLAVVGELREISDGGTTDSSWTSTMCGGLEAMSQLVGTWNGGLFWTSAASISVPRHSVSAVSAHEA